MRQDSRGFTLVELLVVISIIALLLSILMPALHKARVQAKRVYCLSNSRQMAIAAASYHTANNGFFPIAYWSDTQKNYCWDFTTYQKNGKTVYQPGLLWQNETIDEVQQCPSYKGGDNWAGIKFTGYNYNTSFIGHGQGESITDNYRGLIIKHPDFAYYEIVMPVKIEQVKNPTSTAVFGDGHYAGGANKFMRSPDTWEGDNFTGRTAGTQGFRHGGQTNISWADGHATSLKKCYTDMYNLIYDVPNNRGKEELDDYNEDKKLKIGFISSDNSLYDLK